MKNVQAKQALQKEKVYVYPVEISRKDMLLLVTSFVCSISWFVLAKSHSFIHRKLNCALWYLPYIPVALYILVNNLLKFNGKGIDYKLLIN